MEGRGRTWTDYRLNEKEGEGKRDKSIPGTTFDIQFS